MRAVEGRLTLYFTLVLKTSFSQETSLLRFYSFLSLAEERERERTSNSAKEDAGWTNKQAQAAWGLGMLHCDPTHTGKV